MGRKEGILKIGLGGMVLCWSAFALVSPLETGYVNVPDLPVTSEGMLDTEPLSPLFLLANSSQPSQPGNSVLLNSYSVELPEEFFDYLFMKAGDEGKVDVDKPVSVGGFLGSDFVRLVRQSKFYSTDSLWMQNAIMNKVEQLEDFTIDNGNSYKVINKDIIISELVPGWQGIKISFSDPYSHSRKDAISIYLLPTTTGHLLFFTEATDDSVEESRKKSQEVYDYFMDEMEKIIGELNQVPMEQRVLDLISAIRYEGKFYQQLREVEKERVEQELRQLREGGSFSFDEVVDIKRIKKDGLSFDFEANEGKGNITGSAGNLKPAAGETSVDVGIRSNLLPQFQDFKYRNVSLNFNVKADSWDIKGANLTAIVLALRDSEDNEIEIVKPVDDESIKSGVNINISEADIASAKAGVEEFNNEVRNLVIKFRFNVTGFEVLGRKRPWGQIVDASFTISDFRYTKRPLSETELLSIKEKELMLPSLVASLFGYPSEEFRDILNTQNPYSLPYKGIYNKWFERMMDAGDPYDVSFLAGLYKENIKFLSGRRRDRIYNTRITIKKGGKVEEVSEYYFPASLLDYESSNDRAVLREFSDKVLARIDPRSAIRDINSLKRVQEDVFRRYWGAGPYDERTLGKSDFVRSQIIPLIEAYMGYSITDKKGNFTALANAGSTYSHSLYWLSLKLYDKYRDFFTPEERQMMENIISREFEAAKKKLGVDKLSDSWQNAVRERVHNNFAIAKVMELLDAVGMSKSLDNFIKWITMNFSEEEKAEIRDKLNAAEYDGNRIVNTSYGYRELKDLYERIKAQNFIRKKIPVLFGKPELTYQKEIAERGIGDKDFLKDVIFKNAVKYLLRVYDPKSYLIMDNPASSDASVMALGFATGYLAALSKQGLLKEEDIEPLRRVNPELSSVKEMLRYTMQTLLNIQEAQPRAEWINKLLPGYSLDMIELLAKLARGELSYPAREELGLSEDEYEKLTQIDSLDELVGNSDNWAFWVERYYAYTVREKINKQPTATGISILKSNIPTPGDADYIKQVKQEEIDKIRQYGWGGWLYHFYTYTGFGKKPSVEDYRRSRPETELTPLDTALTAIGFYIAGMIFPELRSLAEEFIDNIDMDGIMWNRDAETKRYHMAWVPQAFLGPYSYNGFTPDNFIYRSQEELALEFVRAIWALRNTENPKDYISWYEYRTPAEGEYDVAGVKYDVEEDILLEGYPPFLPAVNGASWVYGLIPIDLRGKDKHESLPTDWYLQSVMGYLYNRIASLKYGYGPYNAQVGSMEILGKGYDMGLGLPPLDPELAEGVPGLDSPSTIPVGQPFSIYSLNLSALPGESLFSLWYQYLTNPRNVEGEFGFRSSFNRESNFWASSYYTFDITTFGLNTINALYGTIWDLFGSDREMLKVYNALGYDISAKMDEYEVSISSILPFIHDPLPEPARDADLRERIDSARAYVERVVDIAKAMTSKDLEYRKHGVKILRYYLDVNDELYKKAMGFLPDPAVVEEPELKAEVLALRFVINKNQFHYQQQKETFDVLTNFLAQHPEYIDTAADIISSYDYEAQVMWKAWDPARQQFVPVLSREEIVRDLTEPGEQPRTAYYPELEEYLGENWRPYPLFPEDSGLLAPYVLGTDVSKGLLQLARSKGWQEAARIYQEELEIQSRLRPYVEKLLGRKLNLANPDGKDAGFLSGFVSMVEGGITRRNRYREIMGRLGTRSERPLKDVVQRLEYFIWVKPLMERQLGHKLDLVDNENDLNKLATAVYYLEAESWSKYEFMSYYLREVFNPTRWERSGAPIDAPLSLDKLAGLRDILTGEGNITSRLEEDRIGGKKVKILSIEYEIENADSRGTVRIVPDANSRDWSLPNRLVLYVYKEKDRNYPAEFELQLVNKQGERAKYYVELSELPAGEWVKLIIPLKRYIIPEDISVVKKIERNMRGGFGWYLDQSGDDRIIVWDGFFRVFQDYPGTTFAPPEDESWKKYIKTPLDPEILNYDINYIYGEYPRDDPRNITDPEFRGITDWLSIEYVDLIINGDTAGGRGLFKVYFEGQGGEER